jgi:hypothetical protein
MNFLPNGDWLVTCNFKQHNMKHALLILVSGLILWSCSKEGPRGPQGYPGNDGSDGSTPKLYYFDIPVNQYNKMADYNNNSYDYNNAWIAFGSIDGVTLTENDLVSVFMHQTTDGGPDNYFHALPYLDYFDNGSDFNQYGYGIMDDNGDLLFSIRRNDGSAPFNDMNATWAIQYNVYVIKGTASRKAELPKDLEFATEKELCDYLGITQRTKAVFIPKALN